MNQPNLIKYLEAKKENKNNKQQDFINLGKNEVYYAKFDGENQTITMHKKYKERLDINKILKTISNRLVKTIPENEIKYCIIYSNGIHVAFVNSCTMLYFKKQYMLR